HADDGVRLPPDQNGAADNAVIAAEVTRPQAMTQDDNVIMPRFFLVHRECSSQGEVASEQFEIRRRGPRAQDDRRLTRSTKRLSNKGAGGYLIEDSISVLPVDEIQRRDDVVFTTRFSLKGLNESIRVGIRQ